MSNDLDASGFSDKLILREGREARLAERGYPAARVQDNIALFQERGQPFRVELSWNAHHTGVFNLSHSHAVALRNALDQKLAEYDAAALQRLLEDINETVGDALLTEEDLDRQPIGTVIADKDHDDWTKEGNGEWRSHGGPRCRAKTMVTLWGPFTVVRFP